MNQLPLSRKKYSAFRMYALLAAIIVMCVIAALIFWYKGFTEGTETDEVTTLRGVGVNDLWFSPSGYLVGVNQNKWAVDVMMWPEAGGTPSLLLRGEGLQGVVTRFDKERPQTQPPDALGTEENLAAGPAPLYAVARDASKIALIWRGYLIVKSLSADAYNATPKPFEYDVSGLAFTENNRLAVLLSNGVINLYDADNLSLIDYETTALSLPTGIWASGRFVVAASFKDSTAIVFDTERIVSGSYESSRERFPLTDAGRFALSISLEGKLAIATGRPEVSFAGDKMGAPGDVSDLAVYSEKSYNAAIGGTNRVLAVGNFAGVYLLSTEQGKERVQFADAAAGTRLLAFKPPRLALSGDSGVVLLTLIQSRRINLLGWFTIFALSVYLLGGALILRSIIRQRLPRSLAEGEEAESASAETASVVPPAEAKEEGKRLPLPEPPEKLVQACAAGECVLYAGAGLGAQAGLPTWTPLMRGLVDWAARNKFIDGDFADSMREALRLGLSDSVADSMINRLQERRELLNEYLRDIFLKTSAPSATHNALKEIKFSAVLTANFDNLLEQTFGGREASTYTPADTERLLETLTTNEFYHLKLYGTLERPETVIMAPAQYEDFVKGNLAFSRYMEALFVSRTLLFIGSSLEGIEAYLKGITFSRQSQRTHYALVAVEGSAWRAKVEPLKTRYGIEVLPYSYSQDFGEMETFIKNLAAKVVERASKGGPDGSTHSHASTRVKSLHLTNVGPFEDLEVEFDANWNILLGDNGVGKSTILKAIAVAICGEDAKPFAGRLIKGDQETAEIILKTERNTYTTRLRRIDDDKAEVESVPRRAFETEGWLALGFPPLRVVSWVRTKSAGTKLRRRPVVDDLLPLITGTPDARPDDLKQWIVDLDYQIKDLLSRGDNATRQLALRDEFFEVISGLTHDFEIKFHSVEITDQTYKVMIETEDGPLPIEALSQGMVSLIGWVGILLRRLHDIYGGGDDPKKQYALVLMDELDAHLHPAWQQSLVRVIGEIFPRVQFIATTHSPLIVGGMRPEQVKRFIREEDGIVLYDVEEEMLVGRADQILTGDGFGLASTFVLNKDMEKDMEEYRALLAKGKQRTPEEETRYQKLRAGLQERVPLPGETPPVRRAQELLDLMLKSEADGNYEEAMGAIREKAKRLLTEVEKERK